MATQLPNHRPSCHLAHAQLTAMRSLRRRTQRQPQKMFDFRNRNLGSSLAVAVPLRQSALPSPPSSHLLSLTFTLLPKVALRLATMSSQDSGALGGLAPQSASPPLPSSRENECRRSVDDLPPRFQSVFSSNFRHFNEIQSKLFEYLIGGDKTLGKCCNIDELTKT